MKNAEKNLGLPIEYQQIPEYFDAHNINEQTDTKNSLIEKLLQEKNVKTVLDMTCGTGSQVFHLAAKGYDIMGSDFSPALINLAREKAKEMNCDLTFIDGDMRTLHAGQFDAVITIFSAIGHLKKTDIEAAFKNVGSNLKEGGIYVFDNFNPEALSDEVIKTFVMDVESTVNGTHIRNQQRSEIDRESNQLISHDNYTISKPACNSENYSNTFRLQLYTADELTRALSNCGFEVIQLCDMDGNEFLADKSLNILIVAKKSRINNSHKDKQ
jgi:ubiquinone/menaquinone biosynthesis C-methylase UbiE